MIRPSRPISVADVAAHYDDLDRFYREVWGQHVHHGLWKSGHERPEEAVQELARLIAEKADIGSGDIVCDVGCGYGATALQLVREYGADVVGLTVSPSQFRVATAQTLGSANPRFLLRNWEANGLAASSFCAVVSIECLAHVSDKRRFFSEISRVLQPGKKAAITAWLSAAKPKDWHVRHLLEPICSEGRLAGLGTASEYERMMESVGLELVEFQSLRREVQKTWSICARRVVAGILTKPAYRRFLLQRPTSNWVFLVTLWRIILAYRLGAMDYGLFVARRPPLSE